MSSKFKIHVLDSLSREALDVVGNMSAKELSLYARDHKNSIADEISNAILTWENAKPVTMSERQATKLSNKQAFVTPVMGLKGNVEYVTRGLFEQLTGLPGHIPADLAISNPSLWTNLGSMFYQDSMIPFGVVAQRGETLHSVCSVQGWDYGKTRITNQGRNVPLSSKFDRPVIVLPPTHKPPKAKLVTPGGDAFLALFGAAKGSKYESTLSSAHSLGTHTIDHVLAIDLMWSSGDADYDGFWTKTKYQNSKGEFLFFLEGDGSHWMNEAAKQLLEASVVQFRSISLQTAMQIKTHAEKHLDNAKIMQDLKTIYRQLTWLASTDKEEFRDELICEIEETCEDPDVLTLLDAVIQNPEAWARTRSSDPIWNGKKLFTEGQEVHVKGIGEISYASCKKPDCPVQTERSYFVKGLSICPNVKEEFAKMGGSVPTIFVSPFETKGVNKHQVEKQFVDHVIANHGDAVGPFVAKLPLDKMVFSIHERLKSGKTALGYQQYSCIPNLKHASKDSIAFYKSLLEEVREIYGNDFDLPKSDEPQAWEDLSRELQFINLFGYGSDQWHEAVMKRLKSDSLNLSLIELFGEEAYLATETGRQNYYETRDKMAEILFKGGGIQATYARYLKPTRHQVKKIRKTQQELGSCSGITEVPEFWKGRKGRLGHGTKVLTSTSRVPVVTMTQPVVEYDRMSKYIEGTVAPPEIAVNKTVGDWDGDAGSKCHFTPKEVYDQIVGKKNKRTALIHAIVVASHSLEYIDVYEYDVESVSKDNRITFGETVVNGQVNWAALERTVEPMQGYIGTYAYHFVDSLVYNQMDPVFGMIQQGAYQGEIDMQGGVLNKTYLLDESNLIIDGNKISIKPGAFDEVRPGFLQIQQVLMRDPSMRMRVRAKRQLHWELFLPTDLKQRMQIWARGRTFGEGKFFEYVDEEVDANGKPTGKTVSYHVHRGICIGWRKAIRNEYGEPIGILTGQGLTEINPFAPSLPVQDRWLRLMKGMGKRTVRHLPWLNEEFNWFMPVPKKCSTGKASWVGHVFNSCKAICDKARDMPKPSEFWCPLGTNINSDVAAKLETVLLGDLKRINGYVFLPLEKEECKEVASNFLQYVPFFRWTKDVSFIEELLGLSRKVIHEFGITDEHMPRIVDAVTSRKFWEAERNEFSSYNESGNLLFVHRRALHLFNTLSQGEDAELADELSVLEDSIWSSAKNRIQRLFEAFAANSSTNFCNIWESILPNYESEQASAAYVALADAHGTKTLTCMCCKRAFDKFTTPVEVSEEGMLVNAYHDMLVRLDKNIDNLVLSDDAPELLVQLQEKRALRFLEANGKGQKGYNLDEKAARHCKTQEHYAALPKQDVTNAKRDL